MALARTPMVLATRPRARHHPSSRLLLSLSIEFLFSMLLRWP